MSFLESDDDDFKEKPTERYKSKTKRPKSINSSPCTSDICDSEKEANIKVNKKNTDENSIMKTKKIEEENMFNIVSLLESQEILKDLVNECKDIRKNNLGFGYLYKEEYEENETSICLKLNQFATCNIRSKRIPLYNMIEFSGEFVEMFIFIYNTCFLSMGDSTDEIKYKPLRCILLVLWNGVECSESFCKTIYEKGGLEYIFKNLITNWRFKSDSIINIYYSTPGMNEDQRVKMLNGLLDIAIKVLLVVDSSVVSAREWGTINVMENLLVVSNKNHLPLFLEAYYNIIISFLVKEDEKDTFRTSKRVIKLLFQFLEDTFKHPKHLYASTYSFIPMETILVYLSKIAVSEKNKEYFSKKIDLLIKVLKKSSNSKEKEMENSLTCLWTLVFNNECKNVIKLEHNLKVIKNLQNISSLNEILKRVNGILWEIEGKFLKPKQSEIVEKKNINNGHIMLSYNWGFQETVIKIKEFLVSKGFKVWFDLDCMEGSTLESMGRAVDNSYLVLLFFSQKYKNSPNCRSEAEYAHTRKKNILPIRAEKHFDADGWLGIIIGSKLWIDFSNPNEFDNSLPVLEKQIGRLLKDENTIDKYNPSTSKPVSNIESENEIIEKSIDFDCVNMDCDIKLWTEWHVFKFVKESCLPNKLYHFKEWDGEALLELRKMMKSSPSIYYSYIKDELHMTLLENLKFTKKLRKINK